MQFKTARTHNMTDGARYLQWPCLWFDAYWDGKATKETPAEITGQLLKRGFSFQLSFVLCSSLQRSLHRILTFKMKLLRCSTHVMCTCIRSGFVVTWWIWIGLCLQSKWGWITGEVWLRGSTKALSAITFFKMSWLLRAVTFIQLRCLDVFISSRRMRGGNLYLVPRGPVVYKSELQ